jgi:Core-2/I-Branching enzyme
MYSCKDRSEAHTSECLFGPSGRRSPHTVGGTVVRRPPDDNVALPACAPRRFSFADERMRIAYFITVANAADLPALSRLLGVLFNVHDLFVIHLDARATPETVRKLERIMEEAPHSSGATALAQSGGDAAGAAREDATAGGYIGPGIWWLGRRSRPWPSNMVRLSNPVYITWGGFTALLATMYGLAAAATHRHPWEYWINLSAHDMPLLPAEELREVLSQFAQNSTSFIAAQPYNLRHTDGVDWRRRYTDDKGLYKLQVRVYMRRLS